MVLDGTEDEVGVEDEKDDAEEDAEEDAKEVAEIDGEDVSDRDDDVVDAEVLLLLLEVCVPLLLRLMRIF